MTTTTNGAAKPQAAAPKRQKMTVEQKVKIMRFMIGRSREIAETKPPLDVLAAQATKELGWRVKPRSLLLIVEQGGIDRWWPEGKSPPRSQKSMAGTHGWNRIQHAVSQAEAKVAALEDGQEALAAAGMRLDARVAMLESRVVDLMCQLGVPAPAAEPRANGFHAEPPPF